MKKLGQVFDWKDLLQYGHFLFFIGKTKGMFGEKA